MTIESDEDTERSLSAESTVEESPQKNKKRKIKSSASNHHHQNMSKENPAFDGQNIKDTKYPTLPPKSTKLYNDNSEEVFCICRKEDNGELMVGCDGCDDWYHFKCMKINLKYKDMIANYYCPYCEIEGKGTTLWKRKCRVEGCYKPIFENKSKYCSKEHGIQYLSNIVNVKLKAQENTPGVLTRDQLGDMAKFSQNIDQFKNLGDKLPDVPGVDLNKDSRVVNITDSIELLKSEKEINLNKKKILLKSRENLKKLNEVLTADSDPGTSKKKVKKVDLCGYDLIFNDDKFENNKFDENDLVSNDIEALKAAYEKFTQEDINDTTVCFIDRKKCQKHNGWISVINDDIDFKLRDIDKKTEKNIVIKEKILKTLKVDFFERKI